MADDAASQGSNRGAWIIAGAILVAAVLVIGVLIFQSAQDDACKRWQAKVQSWGDDSFGAVVFGDERPDACPLP